MTPPRWPATSSGSGPGFRLAACRAFDLFPQTAHVETVAILEPGMKYFVSVGGRQVEVEVDGDRVTVNGETHEAALRAHPGTPLRLLSVDG